MTWFRLHSGQSIASVVAPAITFYLSVPSSVISPLALSYISATHWKFFWSLSPITIQRSVMCRFIVWCIPHCRFLHFSMSRVFIPPPPFVQFVWFSLSLFLQIYTIYIARCYIWALMTTDIKEVLSSLNRSDIWYYQWKEVKQFIILLVFFLSLKHGLLICYLSLTRHLLCLQPLWQIANLMFPRL